MTEEYAIGAHRPKHGRRQRSQGLRSDTEPLEEELSWSAGIGGSTAHMAKIGRFKFDRRHDSKRSQHASASGEVSSGVRSGTTMTL